MKHKVVTGIGLISMLEGLNLLFRGENLAIGSLFLALAGLMYLAVKQRVV